MEPLYKADLHCHTTASDGLLSPCELLQLAQSKGLKAIAVTDHDTIRGWAEAEQAGEKYSIEVIKGIEINTEWNKKEIHILGYGLKETAELNQQLGIIQKKREGRIHKILDKLHELEMPINEKEVFKFAKGDSVGRPHIAQAMAERGYVKSVKEGFDNYLRIGAQAYVPRYKLEPEKVIRIIRDAEGVAVLAHPGAQDVSEEAILSWVDCGLQGIEVSHPDHTKEVMNYYKEIAQRRNLLVTGGSDFHGEGIKPGIYLGKWGVDLEKVKELKALIKVSNTNNNHITAPI